MYEIHYETIDKDDFVENLSFLQLFDLLHKYSFLTIISCTYYTDYRRNDVTKNVKIVHNFIVFSKLNQLTKEQLDALHHNALAVYFGGEYV